MTTLMCIKKNSFNQVSKSNRLNYFNDMETINYLYQSDFFKFSSQKTLEALAQIAIPKTLNKGEVLFTQGDKAHCMYLLAAGNVQLHKEAQDGKNTVIKVVRPVEIFAEAILFEADTYPVSAQALVKSIVLLLPKHQISCLLANEDFRNDFIGMLMKKIRYLANQINQISANDVSQRLIMFLKDQFPGKNDIVLNISKKDVAAAIGTTPETLSRVILKLAKAKKMVWKGKKIELKNS